MSGNDSHRAQLLVAMRDFEQVIKHLRVPCVLVVGLPKTQEVATVVGGLTPANLPGMCKTVTQVLEKAALEASK